MPNVLFPIVRATLRGFGEVAPETAAAWFERRLTQPRRLPPLQIKPPVTPATRRRIAFGASDLALTEWGSGGSGGSGPTVLLIHGWESDSRSFWSMVDPLVALGMRPVAFDLPAHGESGGRHTNMPDCSDALLQVARAVGPVHGVVAHSFGAPVTGLAVRHGLQLQRLAMIAPPRSVHAGLNEMTVQVGLPQHVWDRIAHSLSTRLKFVWSELDTDWLIAHVDAEVLVVHDEDDRAAPWSHGAAVARAARRGRMLTTAGLGHRRVLADQRVLDHVARFLAQAA